MRLYPQTRARRLTAIARDALMLSAVLVFAWLGLAVHDAVDALSTLGRGVTEAGTGVERGFASAADAVSGAPLIGEVLAGGLRDAGRGTGGEVAQAGRSGEEAVHRLANLLGWLIWAIPTGLLLLALLPGRVAEIRRLTAASRALADPPQGERRRMVAMRSAFSLPYGQLLRYTRDPLGDLAAGRYDPLLRAAYEDAGLRAPGTGRESPS